MTTQTGSKARFEVLSPDGILIAPRTWATREQAEAALTQWCERFEIQGYYAAVNGRITLADLRAACEIKEIPQI